MININFINFMKRFILIAENSKKIKIFNFFSKLKIKHFLIGFILFGCILCFFRLFQYRLNEFHFPYNSFPLEFFNVKYCSITLNNMCKLFKTFKITEAIVNDIIIFILNFLVDIFLYGSFKKEIENKKKLSTSNQEELDKKQKDLSRMLILNGVLYFLSHFPEFITTLVLNLLTSNRIFNFCTQKFECDVINENAEFFSLISITCQFFIFLRFNCLFNSSFKDRKEKFKQILKNIFVNRTRT